MSSERSNPRSPTGAEEKILLQLLSKDFRGRDMLLAQVKNLKVRQLDPEGSLLLAPESDAPIAEVKDRVPVEAEVVDDDGVTIRVLLHVVKGHLAELEIYKDDLSPVQKQLQPERLRLSHAQT